MPREDQKQIKPESVARIVGAHTVADVTGVC
jgi:hypothetical protein